MSSGTMAKIGIFGAIIAALAWGFQQFTTDTGLGGEENERIDYAGAENFYPTGGSGELVRHAAFTLSYDEEWEQAEWTAHILTRENLQKEWTERSNDFRPDPKVSTQSATDDDYRGSGYDRGHLVPNGDLAWDAAYSSETFLMSNISPQARQFNQGIWRELEETTRDWAKKFGRLYVITGPVMTENPKGTIGRQNRIAIPAAYFKVLLDLEEPELKGIGFVIPNQVSFDPLFNYAKSIDEVEAITGLDFFANFMPEGTENELEAKGNIDLWPFNKNRYDKRINNWNNVSSN